MRFMERILVVSSTEKTHAMLAQFLSSCGVQSQLCRAMAGSEARRALVDGEFDLVLVNTPLPDEFGHELAQLAAGETTAGVILLAKAEIADSVAEKVEDDGVFHKIFLLLYKEINLPFYLSDRMKHNRRLLMHLSSYFYEHLIEKDMNISILYHFLITVSILQITFHH